MYAMLQENFLHPELASALLPHAFDHRDGAHDEAHLVRVWRNVVKITEIEGGKSKRRSALPLSSRATALLKLKFALNSPPLWKRGPALPTSSSG